MNEMTPWETLGGDAVFQPLLLDFYARISRSPIAKLFPPDLDETQRKGGDTRNNATNGQKKHAA